MEKISKPGIGVDAQGGGVIDPTANVISLTEAANKRQDDLREMHNQLIHSEVRRLEQLVELRAEHADKVTRLHQEHDREIHRAEQDRLNSIRLIDVGTARVEADRAQRAIDTLATTNKTDAENLRNALNTTASTMAKQTSDMADALQKQTTSSLNEITTRIAALEKSSYEGVGRQRVADPMISELLAEVKSLRESRAGGAAKTEGAHAIWGYVFGAIGMAGVVFALFFKLSGAG